MSDFFDTPLSEFDTLEHHGIKGQKWGVRNAEWYPIDAYRKAKGIVVDAANSNTAKAIKSGTATAAKKTAEATKKTAKAVEEAYKESRAKKKVKKEEKKVATAEKRRVATEEEKQRILKSGTPGEVIKIADQLTNEELNWAKNRNELLSRLRELEGKRVSEQKAAQKRNSKWGKLVRLGETIKMASQPAEDVATALQRFKKLIDVFDDDKDKEKKKKTSPKISEILKNPDNYTDEQVKNARLRQANLEAMEKANK